MKKIEHFVTSEQGIHAHIAVVLAQTAKKYSSHILLWKGDESADMKNMIETVALCVKQNTSIRIEITGEDEESAAEELTKLLVDL